MIVSCSGPPAAYNVGDAQYTPALYNLLAQLGVNGWVSNLPTGSLDSERATRWANALGTTNSLLLKFLLLTSTERPTQATVNARVQAGALFVAALVAAGVPAPNIVCACMNEPASTLAYGDNTIPDTPLITTCQYILEAYATYMPSGVLTGSPTFYGAYTDFVGSNIGAWAVAGQSMSWNYSVLNSYPKVPYGFQPPAEYGASVAALANNQISLLRECFNDAPVWITETAPIASALPQIYDPVTYVKYQLASLQAIPSPGHLDNGAMGMYGALSTTNNQPSGNIETDGWVLLNGELSTTGIAMLKIATPI